MRDWEEEIQSTINQHTRTRRRSIIGVFLALIVAVGVFGSLILPAISITMETAQEASDIAIEEEPPLAVLASTQNATQRDYAIQTLASDYQGKDTSGTYNGSEGTGYNFDGNITSSRIKVGNKTASSTGNRTIVVTEDDIEIDKNGEYVSASITLNFAKIVVAAATGNTSGTDGLYVSSEDQYGNHTIYYELPDDFVVDLTQVGYILDQSQEWNTSDINPYYNSTYVTSSSSESGIYWFVQDEETGKCYIVIEFMNEYLEYASKRESSNGIQGDITFSGKIYRANTADGDVTIEIGGKKYTINFPDLDFSVAKSGALVQDSNGDYYIEWTIAIENPNGDSLNNATISDKYLSGDVSYTIDPSNVMLTKNSDGAYTISSVGENDTTITITYRTAVSLDDFTANGQSSSATYVNDVTLTDDDVTATNSAKVTVTNTTISKSGQADYYETGSAGGYINWTVNLTNQLGTPLAGYVITDTLTGGSGTIDISTIKIVDENGNILAGGTDYTVSESGGNLVITFGDSVTASSVTITYKSTTDVAAEADAYYTNKVEIKDGPSASANVTYKSYSSLYKITKDGSYDYDTGVITWTVTLSADTSNNPKATLKEQTITDARFSGLTTNDLTFTTNSWNISSDWTDAADVYILDGDSITIITDITSITFTYTTEATEEEISAGTAENTASITDGTHKGSDSKSVGVGKRHSISKRITSGSYGTDYGQETTQEISYAVSITDDDGIIAGESTLIDVISVDENSSSNVTISLDTSSVVVTAKTSQNGQAVTLTAETDYTAEYANGQITITFIGENLSDYHYIDISYTVDVTFAAIEWDVEGEGTVDPTYITNSAHWGEYESGSVGYTENHTNPYKVEKMNAGVQKVWKFESEPSKKPTSIQFDLQVSVDGGAFNQYYDKDRNSVYIVLSDSNNAASDGAVWTTGAVNPAAVTGDTETGWHLITEDGNSYYLYEGLIRSEIVEENGTYVEHTYAYQWVESFDGKDDNWTMSSTVDENGLYTITNAYAMHITKKVVDGEGNDITGQQITLDDLVCDDEYYYVNYVVEVPYADGIIDIIPEGFKLVRNDGWDNAIYGNTETGGFAYHGIYDKECTFEGLLAGIWGGYFPGPCETFDSGEESTLATYSFPHLGSLDSLSETFENWTVWAEKATSIDRMQYAQKYHLEENDSDYSGSDVLYIATDTGSSTPYVGFSLCIKKADLEEKVNAAIEQGDVYTFTNIAHNDNYATDSTASLSIGEAPEKDTSILEKVATKKEGQVDYTLVVNSEGKTLSNDDTYDIVDKLTTIDMGGTDYTIALSEVKAYYINEDGSRGDELPSSMYSYSFDSEPSYAYETPESEVINGGTYSAGKSISINSSKDPVESISITFNSLSSYDAVKLNNDDNVGYAAYLEGTWTNWGRSGDVVTDNTATYGWSWDVSSMTLTFNLNAGKEAAAVTSIYVDSGNNIGIASITVNYVTSYTQTAYSTITITVPDATPLMIQYTYSIIVSAGSVKNGVIVNKAEINTGNVIAIDSQKVTGFEVSNSTAHSVLSSYPQIAKVNVASTGENLKSSFYLKRFNATTGKWEYAIYIGTDDSGNLLVSEGGTFESEAGTFISEDKTTIAALKFDSCWVSEDYVELRETDDGLELVYTGDSITVITSEQFVVATTDETTGETEAAHWEYTYRIISKNEILGNATIDLNNKSAYYNTFESGVLYALIEAETPEGYQDAVGDVYYFVYDTTSDALNSVVGAYNGLVSDDDKLSVDDVNSIAASGKVAVPNNKLINISATKLWNNGELGDAWEVEYTLYYATEKGLSAISIDDIAKMTKVTNEDLYAWTGEEIDATQTLTSTADIAEWDAIPNGSNGVARYYYVVETAYTIGSTTYRLNIETGYYEDESGTRGTYQPIYFNNGLCEDGSVTVNNSSGISIRKQWTNSDNSTKLNAPIDAIGFTINGQNSGSESTVLAKGILTKAGNWTLDLNGCDSIKKENILEGDSYKTYYPQGGIYWYDGNGVNYSVENIFTMFDTITVTEYTLTDADTVSLYGYVESVTYNIIDNSYGLITMTNKDSSPSSSSVKVTKEWEGISESDREGVYVTLFRTTTSHTMSNLTSATSIPTDFEICDTTLYYHLLENGTIEFEEKANDDDEDKAKTYTEEEVIEAIAGASTLNEDEDDNSEELDNPYAEYGYYVLVKGVEDATVCLDDTDNWQYAWEDLTYRDDAGNTWYYYVLETDEDGNLLNSEDWNVKYTLKNGSAVAPQYTVTNYTSGNLIIEKKWVDTDGNALSSSNIPDSITFQVYEKKDESDIKTASVKTFAAAGSGELPEELLVASIGDSITLGTFNGYVGDEYTYPYQLDDLLLSAGISPRSDVTVPTRSDGTEMIVDRNGTNSAVISSIKGAAESDSYLPNADAVTLIAGTNDIINTSASMDSMKSDLTSLVNTVHSRNSSAAIFLATIPKFAALDWSNSRSIAQYNQWRDSAEVKEQIQAQWDELVGEYNEMVAQVVSECSASMDIYLVDVYSATQDPSGTNEYGWLSADGCHPNQEGYAAIANAFYNAIYEYYTGETVDDDTEMDDTGSDDTGSTTVDRVTGLPSDFYKVDENGEYITDGDDNYVINTEVYGLVTGYSVSGTGFVDEGYINVYPDESGKWEVTIKGLDEDGEYYVVEYPSLKGFTTTYENNNGKSLADASRTVTVTNTLETFSLNVEKMWSDASDHDGDSVTVNLFRTTNPDDITALDQSPQLTITGTTTVSNGKIIELTTSNEIQSATASGENAGLVDVTCEGTKITVTAAGTGTGDVTLTIIDTNGTRKEITITVTDLPPMYIYDEAPTIKEDGTSCSKGNLITSDVITLNEEKTPVNYFPYADGVQLTNVEAFDYDTTIVSVTIGDNNKIIIKPLKEGTTSIKITAEDDAGNTGYTATISITVVLPETFSIDGDTSVTAGNSITLTPFPNVGAFSWAITSGDDYVAITPNDDGTCTVMGVAEGEAVITATRSDGKPADITITVEAAPTGPVLPDFFDRVGGDNVNHNFNLPDSSSGYATSIIIEFSRADNSSSNFYITGDNWNGANLYQSNGEWYPDQSVSYGTSSSDTYTAPWSVETLSDGTCHLEIALNNLTSSNTFYYTCNNASWNLRYVITCENGSGGVYYIQYPSVSPTSLTPASLSTLRPITAYSTGNEINPNYDYVGSCNFSAMSGWEYIFSSLPLADTEGNTYYYWIEEETPSGYIATYWYSDGKWIDASAVGTGGTAEAIVENVYTESSGTTLPSTGGSGTMPYIITGATLMTGATVATFVRYRRRRRSWSR